MASQNTAGIGSGPRPGFSAWLHHHWQAAADSVKKLLQQPISSALTVLVVGIALALPSFGLSLVSAISAQVEAIDAPPQLSVLAAADASYETAELLAAEITLRPGIASVRIIDRDAALMEFVTATGLASLSTKLSRNPLPHTLWVYPKANLRPAGLQQLSEDLAELPAVDDVILDSRWLERLAAFNELARTVALVLGAVMALGVVLTLGNTLRLGIESRREEIIVIKLIGGGDAFARRPFLYTGLLTGGLGGFAAAGMSSLALLVISAPVSRVFELYDRAPLSPSLAFSDGVLMIILGAILGWVSAWYSAQLHLTRIQPR